MSHEDHCDHEAWTCNRGWHECTDCDRGLGTRHHQLEPHAADTCYLCSEEERHGPTPEEIREAVASKQFGFVTKDSGQREEYDSGMRRDTQEGKPRFDLLLVPGVPYDEQFLSRVGSLLARGADKYGERNWQLANSAEELDRFMASGLRHMMQWMCGEVDEDHAAAVVFNLMAAEYVKGKLKRENPSG